MACAHKRVTVNTVNNTPCRCNAMDGNGKTNHVFSVCRPRFVRAQPRARTRVAANTPFGRWRQEFLWASLFLRLTARRATTTTRTRHVTVVVVEYGTKSSVRTTTDRNENYRNSAQSWSNARISTVETASTDRRDRVPMHENVRSHCIRSSSKRLRTRQTKGVGVILK